VLVGDGTGVNVFIETIREGVNCVPSGGDAVGVDVAMEEADGLAELNTVPTMSKFTILIVAIMPPKMRRVLRRIRISFSQYIADYPSDFGHCSSGKYRKISVFALSISFSALALFWIALLPRIKPKMRISTKIPIYT